MHTESRTVPAQRTAVIRATLRRAELSTWFPAALDHVAAYLRRHDIAPRGFPFARYHVRSAHRFEVETGFPVDALIVGDGTVQPSSLPGGTVVVAWHIGPYDELGEAYEAVDEWLKDAHAIRCGDAWEVYHDAPTRDPHFACTEVVQPCRLTSELEHAARR
ncbi:GyrI-like domain-containing protein [Kribbella shirazensis]|uniref:Effector-binding domain-containing protein n=1 Tax=Kribbella shirazensis TaxID=1105143 RepID=A0A7X5VDH1_9ACTN|nr:GyrI-like domain-containing protein [Kribbella shirazensis]NIK59157.1 effector-binding domain-containing protein [Kribbella shirazensis]